MKTIIKKVNSIIIVITVLILMLRCKENPIIVLPNKPEKLFVAAIIDADDTIKTIQFIKTYQPEYPSEATDSIRGLSFRLYSDENDLFTYQSSYSFRNEITLPININPKLESGSNYYFQAVENATGEIASKGIVPPLPPEFSLDSMKKVVYINNSYPAWANPAMKANLYFTIDNVDSELSYYALVIDGINPTSAFNDNYIVYDVLSSDIPNFVEVIRTYRTVHSVLFSYGQINIYTEDYPAIFFSLQKGNSLYHKISLSVEMGGDEIFDYKKPVRIRLLSITEELYNFEKSKFYYRKTKGDPFEEPVYIKTNIANGYGIFTICRSREIITNLPWE